MSPLRRTTGAPADGGDALLRELLSNLKSSDLKQLLPETYGKVDDKLPSRRPSSGGFRYSCSEILPHNIKPVSGTTESRQRSSKTMSASSSPPVSRPRWRSRL